MEWDLFESNGAELRAASGEVPELELGAEQVGKALKSKAHKHRNWVPESCAPGAESRSCFRVQNRNRRRGHRRSRSGAHWIRRTTRADSHMFPESESEGCPK